MEVKAVVVREADDTDLVSVLPDLNLVYQIVDEQKLLLEVGASDGCRGVKNDDDILLFLARTCCQNKKSGVKVSIW